MSAPSGSKPKVNLRSTAVKRIMQEAAEMAESEEDDFIAAPLESDIFEWHCTMRGVEGSEFEGGLYHLRIILPPSYPMSAPDIMLLTPNGRFELGKKICIDGLTSFHAGSWQPAWGVRTAILGLRSFWMQGGEALSAIGALDYSKEERKRLAGLSREWSCPACTSKNIELLPDRRPKTDSSTNDASAKTREEDEAKPDVLPLDGTSSSPLVSNRASSGQASIGSSASNAMPTSSEQVEGRQAETSTYTQPDRASLIASDRNRTNRPDSLEEPQSTLTPFDHTTFLSPASPPAAEPSRPSRPSFTSSPSSSSAGVRPSHTSYPANHSQSTDARSDDSGPVMDVHPRASGAQTRTRAAPMWLDALIFACLSILLFLVARKLSAPRTEPYVMREL